MSLQRVEESLTRHGYAFVEDEEHPDILRARFDDYRFQFMLTGEERGVLQTRGRWNHTVDVSRKVEIIKLCNEWNMNRIRSEEHTSELQSRGHLVCRLLL